MLVNKTILTRIIILLLFFSTNSFSQNIVLKQDVNTEHFPNISFKINIFNPETKSKEAFKVLENGVPVDFDLESSTPEVKDPSKVVLILFEDMYRQEKDYQRRSFKLILQNSLPQTVNSDDLFNVAVFDRNRDGSTPLRFLSDSFTNDANELIERLKKYNKPLDRFNSQKSSDLYNAINDGLLYLNKNFEGKNKMLVVLSGGKNLELSNYNSLGDLVILARKYKIPVYSVQYMVYEHENIDALAQNSYGKYFHVQGTYKLSGDHSPQTAADSLTVFLNNAVQRLQGKDYTISYNSSFEKDGKLHLITIKTDGAEDNISFKSPVCDYVCWFNKNKTLALSILGGFLLFLILLFFLIRNNRKKRKEIMKLKEEAVLKKIAQQEHELQEQKQKASMLEQKTIEAQRKLEEEKKQLLLEEEKKRKEEELKKIIKEMKAVNGFSKLKIVLPNGEVFDWLIEKPEITVGRSDDNDLQLKDQTVSSHHFKISYNNHEYYIKDLNSSNGIVINGKRVESAKLQNNVAFQVGKVKILFIK